MHLDDTIAAIASAPGGGARGIVRMSGPRAVAVATGGFQANDRESLDSIHEPTALPGLLRLEPLHAPIPLLLYVWPDRRSYTRQPIVELHLPGSPPLVDLVLQNVLRRGARMAEPGEFTLRAFLAGRLDLTQAEAVLGLIDAQHQRQFETALKQLAGGLSGPLNRLRDRLLELLAHLEAGLDFATEDIQFITPAALDSQLREAAECVAAAATQMQSRHEASELPRVVLLGWPNVGKSSLFNALAGQEHAIVSPLAGTTRDYLAVELHEAGKPFRLIDTAGVEASEGTTIHAAAQHMRHEQQAAAQLRVLCLDSTRPLNDWERKQLLHNATPRIVVLTKTDEPPGHDGIAPSDALLTSAKTGRGMAALRMHITETLAQNELAADAVFSTAVRCQDSLRLADESLLRARKLASAGGNEELVALEVRAALEGIGQVVGAVYTDDILDRIFSRFCIGK